MSNSTMRSGERKPSGLVFRALCVALFALAFTCNAGVAEIAEAELVPGEIANGSAVDSALPYGGDVVAFNASNMSTRFGMLSNLNDEVEMSWSDGRIRLTWVPSNRTVYKGFHLNASIDDAGTWRDDNFVASIGDIGSYTYDVSLPDSYCGYAWPVAPIKTDERGGGTTSVQYYLTVPSLDKFPDAYAIVTFEDGWGNVIAKSQVKPGQDAVAPSDPVREGYVFDGWDAPLTAMMHSTTVKARWSVAEGAVSHTVTFLDGYGGTITSQEVVEGDAAIAPPDPVRDGYAFLGWRPSTFSHITADLNVTAQWLDNAQVAVDKAREAIVALPDDPKDLLRDTANEAVAKAAAAYLALPENLKAKISEYERMRLAQCAIAVLPSDPFKVSADHATAIATAEAVVATLSDAQREELDSEDNAKAISSSRSYGRYLENASWALDALEGVDSASSLKDGTYTGQVSSTSSMGKSNSPRSIKFTVKSVTVKDGKAMAVLEHGSNSSQTLKLGGVEYQNLQTDPAEKSYFVVPIDLNSTFHFSVKGKDATDDTDAISYEMTVEADEGSMTPVVAGDEKDGSSGGESEGETDDGASSESASAGGSSKAPSSGKAGSTANLNSLVKNSGSGSSKSASSSAASPALSGAATPAVETRSKGSASASGSGASGNSAKALSAVEDDAAFAAAIAEREDLAPAIAGGMLLFVSGGVLAFTLRFLRRENALARVGLRGGSHA